jgi:hypothetical protein
MFAYKLDENSEKESKMNVKTTTVQITTITMTLKVAKQLLILPRRTREDMAYAKLPNNPILGRVLAHTIRPTDYEAYKQEELGLVETSSGFAWVRPFYIDESYRAKMDLNGIKYDLPEESPFLILI